MITLAVICPDGKDASSFYRAIGPLGALRKIMPDLLVYEVQTFDWRVIELYDLFFMQRPYSQTQFNIAHMIKEQGKPLWLDYDDNLFNLPKDNPCYDAYEFSRPTIESLLELADKVTVSTELIGVSLGKGEVVPNALNDYLFPLVNTPPIAMVTRWRGSKTHDRDLMKHAKAIIECVYHEVAKDWKWVFEGCNPWYLTESIPNEFLRLIRPKDIIEYFHALNSAMVTMVPLADNLFNRSKSNSAWIEATYGGSLTIASNLPEFRRPGVVLSDPINWARDLKQVLYNCRDQAFAEMHVKQSRDYIRENLLLSIVNHKRKEIVESLV